MSDVFEINVGRLKNIESFSSQVEKQLQAYNRCYKAGDRRVVEWNLEYLEPRHTNLTAITAFLSMAYRLRIITGMSHTARFVWNRDLQGFLADINFFRIIKQYDLFRWNEEQTGGYVTGSTNPNSLLIVAPLRLAPREEDVGHWKAWKDETRSHWQRKLTLKCNNLFSPGFGSQDYPEKLRDQIIISAAELILNAHMHGEQAAFIGLQRSGVGITVSVCDSGIGLAQSLKTSEKLTPAQCESPGVPATVASFVNKRDMGLQRVIDKVVAENGYVIVSSDADSITWSAANWSLACAAFDEPSPEITDVAAILGSPMRGKFAPSRQEGGWNTQEFGLSGTRVAFELPSHGKRRAD